MLDAACALELEGGGGLRHLGAQVVDDGGAAALQELLDLAHVAPVVGRADGTAADARAQAHVAVEAGPAPLGQHEVCHRHVVGVRGEVAPGALPLGAGPDADGNHLAQLGDGLAGGPRIGVGPKVARPLAVPFARVLDRGVGIRLGDGDEGIALVVLVVHVEVRAVLLDEVALEHERLVLAADHHVVEAAHHLHHERDLVAVVLQRHVLAHAGAQALCLAHVDDLIVAILPQVAAGLCGNLRHLLGDAGQPLVLGTGGAAGEVGHV